MHFILCILGHASESCLCAGQGKVVAASERTCENDCGHVCPQCGTWRRIRTQHCYWFCLPASAFFPLTISYIFFLPAIPFLLDLARSEPCSCTEALPQNSSVPGILPSHGCLHPSALSTHPHIQSSPCPISLSGAQVPAGPGVQLLSESPYIILPAHCRHQIDVC